MLNDVTIKQIESQLFNISQEKREKIELLNKWHTKKECLMTHQDLWKLNMLMSIQ